MIQTVFLLVDVPNNRILNTYVVVTEDVDKAIEHIRTRVQDKLKPEIGVHLFREVDGTDYNPSERSYM